MLLSWPSKWAGLLSRPNGHSRRSHDSPIVIGSSIDKQALLQALLQSYSMELIKFFDQLLGGPSMISRRLAIIALALGLTVFFAPQASFAAEDHIAEAIQHTEQAIDHGKQGHGPVLAEHAQIALQHAEAGEKDKANPHTEAAIKDLKAAVEDGKAGKAEAATKSAESALAHLSQVK